MDKAHTPNAHTPGPWTVHRHTGNAVPFAIDAQHTTVGEIYGSIVGHAEAEANARLIAQAPRMLAELEEVSHWHDLLKQNYPEMVGLISAAREARAILRAVKGE